MGSYVLLLNVFVLFVHAGADVTEDCQNELCCDEITHRRT